MARILYLSFLPLLFGACMVTEERPIGTPQATEINANALMGDSVRSRNALAEGVAMGQIPSQFKYLDPKTGTTYLINPKWNILPRKPKGAAKSSALLQSWTDESGQIETHIYDCVSPGAALSQNSIGCQVEQGFILVGGGAYVDYGNGAGAFLWESRPLDENLTTWVASSKDLGRACNHTLHTYAIGMRLKDNSGNYITKGALLNHYIFFTSQSSSQAVPEPALRIFNPVINGSSKNVHYLGGGARVNWKCCGNFLTQSEVKDEGGFSSYWLRAKNQKYYDPATITGYGIVIENSTVTALSIPIPNFGSLRIHYPHIAGNRVPNLVGVASLDADDGYVITGPGGGTVVDGGPGRLIFGIKPTGNYTGQISVYSKDHFANSSGYNTVTFTEIKRSSI